MKKRPSREELRQILHDEKMAKVWPEIEKKQVEIRERKKKHEQYLIDNDMEHLLSRSTYKPSISQVSKIKEYNSRNSHENGNGEVLLNSPAYLQYEMEKMFSFAVSFTWKFCSFHEKALIIDTHPTFIDTFPITFSGFREKHQNHI